MEISVAWADDSNDVSHLSMSHLKVLKKFYGVESNNSVSFLSLWDRETDFDQKACTGVNCTDTLHKNHFKLHFLQSTSTPQFWKFHVSPKPEIVMVLSAKF